MRAMTAIEPVWKWRWLAGMARSRAALASAAGMSACVVLAVFLAFLLARIIWVLVGGGVGQAVREAVGVASISSPVSATREATLARITPFVRQSVGDEQVHMLPRTDLSLILHGIRDQSGGESGDGGAAVISASGGGQVLYAEGDRIDDDVTVVEIQSDHVVLRRSGLLERLSLHPGTEDGASRGEALRVTTASRRHIRRALLQLGLSTSESDGRGIRVYPPLTMPIFSKLDIRRGDVISGIGGFDLRGGADIAPILRAMTDADALDIMLVRAGRPHRLRIRFTDG